MTLEEITQDDVAAPDETTETPPPPDKPSKPARKKRLPIDGNNLVLAAMLIGGIAAVYVLKLSVKPEAASAEELDAETKVNAAIAALAAPTTGAQDTKAAAVMDTLDNDARTRQIPLWVMARNPFVFKLPPPKKAVSPDPQGDEPPDQGDPRATDEQRIKARALSAARSLELQSILMVAKPIAMVSGKSLRVGQKIKGWTVSDIKSMQVALTWEDKAKKLTFRYTLRMDER